LPLPATVLFRSLARKVVFFGLLAPQQDDRGFRRYWRLWGASLDPAGPCTPAKRPPL